MNPWLSVKKSQPDCVMTTPRASKLAQFQACAAKLTEKPASALSSTTITRRPVKATSNTACGPRLPTGRSNSSAAISVPAAIRVTRGEQAGTVAEIDLERGKILTVAPVTRHVKGIAIDITGARMVAIQRPARKTRHRQIQPGPQTRPAPKPGILGQAVPAAQTRR